MPSFFSVCPEANISLHHDHSILHPPLPSLTPDSASQAGENVQEPLPPEPPGLQPSPRRPQDCSSLPVSFTVRGIQRVRGTGLAERGALPRPQWLCPLSRAVILSAEALALRRAKQAQRRAQQAPLQLSKEQKELVQTLLGAHTRHVGTMFDQFVQFRVRTDRGFGLKCDPKGARGRWPEGKTSPGPQYRQAPRPGTLPRQGWRDPWDPSRSFRL